MASSTNWRSPSRRSRSGPRASSKSPHVRRERPKVWHRGNVRKHSPRVGIARTSGFRHCTAGVFGNDPRPELDAAVVALRHSNYPTNGKSIPEKEGRPASHSGMAVPAQDEELRDIEVRGIVGRRRTSCDECKTDNSFPAANEKWKPTIRLRPIEWELVVAEAPISAQLRRRARPHAS